MRSVLAAEAQARAIVAGAERAARETDAQARSAAAALRAQRASEAAAEAGRLLEAARGEAERARARILAAADEQARLLEEETAPRMEHAQQMVLQRVLGP